MATKILDEQQQLPRLNTATLASTQLGSLSYERERCATGIVHLGIGAFHRAHQAVYTEDALARFGGNWQILGVSLRSAGVRDQLVPQDGLYTLVEMDNTRTRHQLIGAIDSVLVAPENPQAILDALTSSDCKIISLTITEKGYCHDPATGRLNKQHPDIISDLENPQQPKTAIGFIVEALRHRRELGTEVPTVLCCDNLPNNGSTLKQIVIGYANVLDPGLAEWIAEKVPFPNTMVDRIVPATQSADIEQLAEISGYQDLGMVKAERFSQWVIEDHFAAGRPAWDKVGATMVQDVEPYELAKLRLLNGAHSSLAYLGYLAGYEFAHEVMGDADFKCYLEQLMAQEIAPTLDAPEGLDLAAYSQSLLERFANAGLQHKTYQIAMDGSQKLPQRLLGTLRDQLSSGRSIEHLSFAIAAWMRYVLAFDEKGAKIAVQDPLAEDFGGIEADCYDPQENTHDVNKLVSSLLGIAEIFADDLPGNGRFRERVTYWLSHMLANGVATSMKIFLQQN